MASYRYVPSDPVYDELPKPKKKVGLTEIEELRQKVKRLEEELYRAQSESDLARIRRGYGL